MSDSGDDDSVEDAEEDDTNTKSKSMDQLSMPHATSNTAHPPNRTSQKDPDPRNPFDQMAAVVLTPPIIYTPEYPPQPASFWQNAMHPDVRHGTFSTIQRDQVTLHCECNLYFHSFIVLTL